MLSKNQVVSDWLEEIDKVLEDWQKTAEDKKKLKFSLGERIEILKDFSEDEYNELIQAYGEIIQKLEQEIFALEQVNIKHMSELKEKIINTYKSH